MVKQLILTLLIISVDKYGCSQAISQRTFDSLLVTKNNLYFDKQNKDYYGCGMNIDCMSLPVRFNGVFFNREKKELKISGYVNPMSVSDLDTLGTNIFRIFIARPVKGKLKNVRILANVVNSVIQKSVNTEINLEKMKFSTVFTFSKNECLYIESDVLYRMKEYNIGSLLK